MALAILVILFALLFAPMMAGLDMVATGRADVGMQDACRYALEVIGRELGEAVYVLQSPGADFDPDSIPNNGDEYRIINHSQIYFNPPARDAMGKVYYPPRPAFETVRDGVNDGDYQKVIRYAVHLVNPSQPHDDFNPFALYRQEFLHNPTDPYPYGNFVGGAWAPGSPVQENVLTPKRGSTFVPSTSVCMDCANSIAGYATTCPSCSQTRLMYLFDGLQFKPRRIVGEQLSTQNGAVYTARRGGWDGIAWTGYLPTFSLARSTLDPRISLFAHDPVTTHTHSVTRMDSYTAGPRPVRVRWSADGGTVTVGRQRSGVVRFTAPAPQRTLWYPLTTTADIAAMWPSDTAAAPMDEANAPISYYIEPSVDTGRPALIVSGSVKVRVVADAGGVHREIDLKPTGNLDQRTIAGDEYAVKMQRRHYTTAQDGFDGHGTAAIIRLSRFDPPRPTSYRLFGANPPAITNFEIYVSYYCRRNYEYDAARDSAGQDPFINDIVKVDYSVRSIQDVTLTLQRYTDLMDNGSGALEVPSDETPPKVTITRQVVARSFGR